MAIIIIVKICLSDILLLPVLSILKKIIFNSLYISQYESGSIQLLLDTKIDNTCANRRTETITFYFGQQYNFFCSSITIRPLLYVHSGRYWQKKRRVYNGTFQMNTNPSSWSNRKNRKQ